MWKKYNEETGEWEDNPKADELWNKYLKIEENVDDSELDIRSNSYSDMYSGLVVRDILKGFTENEIKELVPLLYNGRRVREWQMLRNMGYDK